MLGRLEKVDLRQVWQREDVHFTPWLAQADNIALLGEALGLELEVEAVEQSVGPFRADIICSDTVNGARVLIENQLERTDHGHLGQLLTYAAGLEAVTIVWIASKVADEHRKACDWLNEITAEGIHFFALEIELWRIGGSPAAPKFNIVSQPNDWGNKVASARRALESLDLGETAQLQIIYWAEVQRLLEASGGPVRARKNVSGSWVGHGIGRSGLGLNAVMHTRKHLLRVELYFSGPLAKRNFYDLKAHQVEIEAELGYDLDWQELDGRKEARVCMWRADSDFRDRSQWPAQHQWLVQSLNAMHRAFKPYVDQLPKGNGGVA